MQGILLIKPLLRPCILPLILELEIQFLIHLFEEQISYLIQLADQMQH